MPIVKLMLFYNILGVGVLEFHGTGNMQRGQSK
jgi:hypothetical protein